MSPFRPPFVEVDVDAIRAAEPPTDAQVDREADRLQLAIANRVVREGRDSPFAKFAVMVELDNREYLRALARMSLIEHRKRHGVMCSCRVCVERWGAL